MIARGVKLAAMPVLTINSQKEMKRKKKYNDQTGCYVIEIFVDGKYVCSTAQAKTCKQAKERYRQTHKLNADQKVTAFFFYQ